MESYFLKCKKHTKNINPQVSSTSNGKMMILSKCAICGSRKSKFIKKQDAKELLNKLGIKTPLSNAPVLGDILFYLSIILMNEIRNKFLLAGDKFMPQMHLRQPGFTYSACGSFTKNKERIPKFKETGDTSYIYKNELDKVCFQYDMAYGDFKDLTKRTAADKALRDKAFKIASDQKYDGYQRGLASMVYKFFDKKSQGSGRPLSSASQLANSKENIQLADELHKPIIRKLKKRKVYSSFIDNI